MDMKIKVIIIIESIFILILAIVVIALSNGKKGDDIEKSEISIDESEFGHMPNHEIVKQYTLKRGDAFKVELISYGAAIKSIFTKCRHGHLNNRVLGFKTLQEYQNQSLNPYFGSVIGRVANRISNSEFNLNGVSYSVEKNNGENCLHGGINGFTWKNWNSSKLTDGVKFFLTSQDGDAGFPGQVYVEITYRIICKSNTKQNELQIEYYSTTNKETPLDLTNHVYFNLNGDGSKNKIYNHLVKINADSYLDADPIQLIPNGKINGIIPNSKNDFRNYVKLNDRMVANGTWPNNGYDNYFIINQQSGRKAVASVKNPDMGVILDVFSDQNGVQFYTSNFLNLKKPSDGNSYSIHDGFCLETHNYPDAVNKKNFPSSIVKPEGAYIQKTSYVFSIDDY